MAWVGLGWGRYTHLQRAQPILLAHELLAYVEQFERDHARLMDARKRVNQCPLGACALAGTGLDTDRFKTAEILGFEAPMPNSVRHLARPVHLSEHRSGSWWDGRRPSLSEGCAWV
jgi:argininosuccinate lyase